MRQEALFWLDVALDTLKPGPLRDTAQAAARTLEQRLSPAQLAEVRKRRAERGAESADDDGGSGVQSGQN
jgi:hypothetical protein